VSTPTREEFTKLFDRVNVLSRDLDAAHRELRIQFERMAQLQADIDLLRSAWARIGTAREGTTNQAIGAIGSRAK
jgi:hypothetical protein